MALRFNLKGSFQVVIRPVCAGQLSSGSPKLNSVLYTIAYTRVAPCIHAFLAQSFYTVVDFGDVVFLRKELHVFFLLSGCCVINEQ